MAAKTDKAVGYGWDGKRIEIVGRNGTTMLVNKTDAYRLIQVCLAADPRWDVLPADWREHFVLAQKKDK